MVKRMIFLLLGVALILSLGVGLNAQEQKEIPKKAVKLVEKAVEDMKAQKFDKAGEKLAEARELAPDYAPVYVQLSILSQQSQNLDEALSHITKAYELDPVSDGTVHQYALTLLKVAQKKMAERDMNATLSLYEQFAALPGIKSKMSAQFVQVAYNLAGNYLQAKKPDLVIKYAGELLSTPGIESYQQQNLFAYFLLGSAYGQKDETEKSTENLKKFLELNHDNLAPAQFVSLANYLIASSHFDKMVKKIEAMKPEDIEGIKKAAEAQSEMVGYLKEALTADPGNDDAKFILAQYHYYCRAFEQAKTMLDELIAKDPSNQAYKDTLDIVQKAQEAQKKK